LAEPPLQKKLTTVPIQLFGSAARYTRGFYLWQVDQIFAVYLERGAKAYGGEGINQLEHALQTALAAEQAGADAPLIVAGLLHDYGHLIRRPGAGLVGRGVDDRHEILGAEKLSAFFEEAVTMPIKLHVEAKRFLCATDREYAKLLSPASTWSLKLQGGPLSPAAVDAYGKRPFADDAVKLRRWDEAAKVVGLKTPKLEHFRLQIEECLNS
jgi:phosphonate degradation associated HDIG domain protein